MARIRHIAIATRDLEGTKKFYIEGLGLKDVGKINTPTSEGCYLTDGHVTLVIMPWDITDYDATGIITPGMDHIGFKVESVETFKADVQRIADDNPRLAPAPVGTGKEGAALAKLFERSCSLGQHCLADPDGILIDVMAE